ncbi:hypothetical protein [Aeromicrobium sp. 179-A 4D2 NHS]
MILVWTSAFVCGAAGVISWRDLTKRGRREDILDQNIDRQIQHERSTAR